MGETLVRESQPALVATLEAVPELALLLGPDGVQSAVEDGPNAGRPFWLVLSNPRRQKAPTMGTRRGERLTWTIQAFHRAGFAEKVSADGALRLSSLVIQALDETPVVITEPDGSTVTVRGPCELTGTLPDPDGQTVQSVLEWQAVIL